MPTHHKRQRRDGWGTQICGGAGEADSSAALLNDNKEAGNSKSKGEMRGFFPFAALEGQNDGSLGLA